MMGSQAKLFAKFSTSTVLSKQMTTPPIAVVVDAKLLHLVKKIVATTSGSNQQPQQVSNPSYGNIPQNMPQFNNQIQGEPKPSTVEDDIPFIYISNQLTGII